MDKLQRVEDARVKRIEQPQPECGQYWRNIESDEVLLIESIKYVDNEPHTIILKGHPTGRYGCSDSILCNSFLCDFVYEPNGFAIRDQELAALQAEIRELQDSMGKIISEPLESPMFRLTADGKDNLPLSQTNIITSKMWGALNQGVNSGQGMLNAIQSGRLNAEMIEDIRMRANNHLAVAEVKNQMVKDVHEKVSEKMGLVGAFFKERAAAEYAKTADTRKKIEDLNKGIQSLGLYLGENVVVTQIREGARTVGPRPIYLFQAKRYIDEEIAVYTEFDNGSFDFEDEGSFYTLLQKNPDFVNSMIPEEKAIVLVAWRRREKYYGGEDHFSNTLKNIKNQRSWLLFRDGENIWAIDSPIGSHEQAKNLFSTADEMKRLFLDWDNNTITVNNTSFADSIKRQDEYYLHYKRFAILLSGLQDRLGLLGELPVDVSSGKLFSPAVQEKVYIFVHDGEKDFMLGQGLIGFSQWLKDKNKYIRPGSRIVMMTSSAMTSRAAPGAFMGYRFDGTNFTPLDDIFVGEVQNSKGKNVVSIPCTHQYTEKQRNIVVYLDQVEYNGYLCVDMVTIKELSDYIHDRGSRQNYMYFLKLFKAVKHMLEKEEVVINPIKTYLRDILDKSNIGIESDRQKTIAEAIRLWRIKRHFQMPPTMDNLEFGRFINDVSNVIYSLLGHGRDLPGEIKSLLEKEGRIPLRLVTTGKNRIEMYATLKEDEKIKASTVPWIIKIHIKPKKGSVEKVGSKVTVLLAQNSKETVLYEWPQAADWFAEKMPGYEADDIRRVLAVSEHWRSSWESAIPSENSTKDMVNESLISIDKKIRRMTPSNSHFFYELVHRVPVGFIELKGKLFVIYIGKNAAEFFMGINGEFNQLVSNWYQKRNMPEMLEKLKPYDILIEVELLQYNWEKPCLSTVNGWGLKWGNSIKNILKDRPLYDFINKHYAKNGSLYLASDVEKYCGSFLGEK